jgi:hypothetical protein
MTVTVESLPAQQGSLFDVASLETLFQILAEVADVCDIHFEDGLQVRMGRRPRSLEDAYEALLQGEMPGVQIHYFFQSDAWWDTILRTDEGFRLTRQHLAMAELVSPTFTIEQNPGLLVSPTVGALENLVTA